MASALENIIKGVLKADKLAISRAISIIENRNSSSTKLIKSIFPHTGNAYVIGVTGVGGSGKSTLVGQISERLTAQKKKVAVLAVDPSSPFSGGAILGDRIRIMNSPKNEKVFIRSMATRGALGGLAPAVLEAIYIFDAAGFDYVILETVGVGQAEVDVVKFSDTVLLTVVPGLGDEVQALKAGVLEIGDIFVINKSDHDGADRLKQELATLLSLGIQKEGDWKPKIVNTTATTGVGVDKMLQVVEEHKKWIKISESAQIKRRTFHKQVLETAIAESISEAVFSFAEEENLFEKALKSLEKREKSPKVLAEGIIKKFLKG
jgi:LAO/AO transport system kinase